MNALVHSSAPRLRRAFAAMWQGLELAGAATRFRAPVSAIHCTKANTDDTPVAPGHELVCRLTDVPDGGVIGIDLPHPLGLPLVLRRSGTQVRAWLNVCPQDGHRMEWAPGLFHMDGAVLRCANRSAKFALDRNGVCVEGPCRGRSLIAVPVRVDNGLVVLNEAPAAVER